MMQKAIKKTQPFRNITGTAKSEILGPGINPFAFLFSWLLRLQVQPGQEEHEINLQSGTSNIFIYISSDSILRSRRRKEGGKDGQPDMFLFPSFKGWS